MNQFSEERYLKGVVDNDLTILRKIYKESLPEVIKHIRKNSGTLDDAKDVFQEGILAIYKKAVSGNLTLTTTFHVYLFHVCRRIWLKKLKKKGDKTVTFVDSGEFVFEEGFDEQFIRTRKWALFNKKFALMSDDCRKVLKLLFNGKSGKEIANEMGYTEEYAKRKKYKCKIQLAKLIKDDPEFKNLTEN